MLKTNLIQSGFLSFYCFLSLTFLIPFCAAGQGVLEIHQLQMGQADAGIIITRESEGGTIRKIVVIDAGSHRSAISSAPYYLDNIIGAKKRNIDFAIASHYHDDHVAGFRNYFENLDSTKAKITRFIIPGGLESYKPKKPDGQKLIAFNPGANDWRPLMEKGSYLEHFFKMALKKSLVTELVSMDVECAKLNALPAQPFTIDNLDGIPVTLRMVAGLGRTGTGTTRSVPATGKNPNNESLAWVLEFGKFRFYTGGDLGGSSGAQYTDQESLLIPFLENLYSATKISGNGSTTVKGHVCVMKADHHGSNHSNNQSFLNALNPTAILTSTGTGDHFIPNDITLARIKNTNSTIAPGERRGFYFTDLNRPAIEYIDDHFDLEDYNYPVYPRSAVKTNTKIPLTGTLVVKVKSKNRIMVPDTSAMDDGDDGDDPPMKVVDMKISERSAFKVEVNNYYNGWTTSQEYNCHK